MTYELCLEYGTYPLTPKDAYADERKAIPDFIQNDHELLDKLERMNDLFHQLFLTIECQFHYIGSDQPEKIAEVKALYEEIADHLHNNYSDYNIHIEHFVLH
ncbi:MULTISPECIES: hypothetical protein [Streptococcus]|uniref:Uncharacterized protein n=1 Tax=Streptococcus caledonicus TaxID=2614158 RepID=A0ABW0UBZ0_9STRE|nr:hypothetical protein [Streptococcus sp. S784/96/1]